MTGFGPLASHPLAAQTFIATTTTLPAAAGSFSLTGVAASFVLSQAQSVGSYVVTGIAANFLQSLEGGALALTGCSAALTPTLIASASAYAITGIAASYDLTIDPGGIGGAIVPHRAGDEYRAGPVFTRARYRAVLAEAEAARTAEQRERECAARRARALKEAADAAARAAIRARWLKEDALAAAAADERALAGALSALAGAQGVNARVRQSADIAARDAEAAQDDEAIALLLLAS